jgi:hypothetical protein
MVRMAKRQSGAGLGCACWLFDRLGPRCIQARTHAARHDMGQRCDANVAPPFCAPTQTMLLCVPALQKPPQHATISSSRLGVGWLSATAWTPPLGRSMLIVPRSPGSVPVGARGDIDVLFATTHDLVVSDVAVVHPGGEAWVERAALAAGHAAEFRAHRKRALAPRQTPTSCRWCRRPTGVCTMRRTHS